LHITPLHSVKIISLFALCALLDHAIPMRQFAVQDVAKDLGIAMGMGWESLTAFHTILIEDSQTSKVLVSGVVIVCEAEGVV
jgi:hypothetical protein